MVAQKIKSKTILNAMIAVRMLYMRAAPFARRQRAVNTLQKPLARRRSVMDAI